MNEVQTYPYKCTYCNRAGKYRTGSKQLAMAFRCPHDGQKLIVQEPVTPFVETETYSSTVMDEVVEFAHKLSDAVISRLKSAGVKL